MFFFLHRRQFFGYFQLREDVTFIEIFFEMFCSQKGFFFHYYDYQTDYTFDPMKPQPFKFYMHMNIVEMNQYS